MCDKQNRIEIFLFCGAKFGIFSYVGNTYLYVNEIRRRVIRSGYFILQ